MAMSSVVWLGYLLECRSWRLWRGAPLYQCSRHWPHRWSARMQSSGLPATGAAPGFSGPIGSRRVPVFALDADCGLRRECAAVPGSSTANCHVGLRLFFFTRDGVSGRNRSRTTGNISSTMMMTSLGKEVKQTTMKRTRRASAGVVAGGHSPGLGMAVLKIETNRTPGRLWQSNPSVITRIPVFLDIALSPRT